ncbi:hypothetical protein [Amycolatopsis nigrescens]|uniref:hypothetical protein n=1 Tax=Amycolatopsis nigrescens TaxID=381445 RepID=UPI000381691E|nr:hypothetical protein [Amycolatopsis nigrescens]
MSALDELHARLAATRVKLAEATEHTNRAVELLTEAEQAFVAAHDQAEPWLPPQLAGALEQTTADVNRLSAADTLLSGYEASL